MARRRPFLYAVIAAGVAAACSDAGGPGGAATHLAFRTQPSASIPLNPIAGPVQVAVLDADGDVVRGSSAQVTLALGVNPSGSVIIGLASVNAVNGVAEFRTAALSAAGSGYTLVASSTGLTGATSAAFNVAAATPASVVFQTQPAGSVKDSALGPGPIRVALLDQNGDVFPEADGLVQLAIGANPGGAMLSGLSAVASENGVATFSNLRINAVGVGYTLVATMGAAPPATSNAFNVTLSLADIDGDGFSPNAGDCDDKNPSAYPGADDDFPDGSYIDKNCDGIDGDKAKAIFVAQNGADIGACGTQVAPCRTIQFGLQRAVAAGKRDVYLIEGGYNEHVALVNGVGIYGGFHACSPPGECQRWGRGANTHSQIDGTFVGNSADIGAGEPQVVTVYGANLTTPITIADLWIYAPLKIFDNLTTAAGRGRNSHAVILRNVPAGVLTFERGGIVANAAYHGLVGANGGGAPITPASGGGIGGDGAQVLAACDDASRGAAGVAGTSPLTSSGGGAGGLGGARHTDCNPGTLNLTPRAGDAGLNAETFQLGVFGSGGAFGPGSEGPCTTAPANGLPGRVTNGAPGAAAAGSGGFLLANDLWAGFDGNPGGLGEDGTGGGGGGGAGGCGGGTNAFGPGGGGGGAGGAKAPTAAQGGRGGGGSFALYLINASPVLRDSYVTIGGGGVGGSGGTGGRGQSGGQGAVGGTEPSGLTGGVGGNGAHGGHGAGGGGGAGGIAAGVFLTSAASAPILVNVTFVGGGGGSGGGGGASAPSAPLAERDGRAGLSGPAGGSFNVRLCASPTAC